MIQKNVYIISKFNQKENEVSKINMITYGDYISPSTCGSCEKAKDMAKKNGVTLNTNPKTTTIKYYPTSSDNIRRFDYQHSYEINDNSIVQMVIGLDAN